MEVHRKALEARVEKLSSERTALDEVNNKLLDKVVEERQQTHKCRINWNTKCSTQECKIREQDKEIRELKRKLMVAEECVLGEAVLSKKIKLSLKELQDNMVLNNTEAEMSMSCA
ncbi:hypothetical protein ACH5RR_003959 [Cinchona calisaya]|uniref:Uncharacterized protein n=1 Tax=Cinchona calisaya TaxID=153742 RepID=A0ABD3AWJ3_9GENT